MNKIAYFSKDMVTSGKGTPEMKFIKLYDKYYVYNKFGGAIFQYEPELKYLFSTDFMHYMLFEHYNYEEMEEISQAQFIAMTKQTPSPAAYENEQGFYLKGQSVCAFCDKERLSWQVLDAMPILSQTNQVPVTQMIEKVESLQEAAYNKAKAEGTLPDFHLFEEKK